MNTADSPTICERIASLTALIAETPLSVEIVEETKLCFLDFLAATLSAQPDEFINKTVDIFGTGSARLLHGSHPISVAGASYVHGFLSTVEDIDDAHALASGMHLSATVFPVALALSQSQNISVSGFLRASVAGYEIAGRLIRSMDGGLRRRGFHATGAIGPFAACATAGILLKLSEAELAHAFGIAASGAGGLFAFLPSGASSRHTHGANACVSGLMAAVAGKNGITGPLNAFEGPDGFIGPYSEECDRAFIEQPSPAGNGTYELMNAYHKKFAACGHAIPAITSALQLRRHLSGLHDQIETVDIYGYKASAMLTNFPARSVGEAKFSLPVIFALSIIFGDVSQSQMMTTAINRPDVQSLAAKVNVHVESAYSEAFPRVRSGRIEVTLQDGGVLSNSTDAPIGMPGNRLGFDDVSDKFMKSAPAQLGLLQSKKIVESICALEDTSLKFPYL
jgi:2-methylcitrate dehydratase PrpD